MKKGGAIGCDGPARVGSGNSVVPKGSEGQAQAAPKFWRPVLDQRRPAMKSDTALISRSVILAATPVIWVLLVRLPSRKFTNWATV